MAQTSLPTTTALVDQRVFIRPLGGPENALTYFDAFPEEVYTRSPDSHLVKFLFTLLGPSGAGWLRKNYLQARLRLEDYGLELFDLDAFFGNPFKFGRIFDEVYDQDPNGLLSQEAWDRIRSRDTQYRNRALDFLSGVRLGNTPLGMEFVAKSGLGHSVEIIENYKYLYDEHSDDPKGLVFYGKTRSTEEMVVLPRREVSISEIQTISITGGPTGGSFKINFNGEFTNHIAFDASAATIQQFLETLSAINPGDVIVSGGPGPNLPWKINFTGSLASQDVPQIGTANYLTGAVGATPLITTRTTQNGVSATDEIAFISPRNQYHLQQALDRIRPVTTIPTFGSAPGLLSQQVWNKVIATSEYDEVVRYVTGNTNISWPARTGSFWIENGTEHQAPRSFDGLSYHYQGWHTPSKVIAYNEGLLADPSYPTGSWSATTLEQYKSEHMGAFSPLQRLVIPFLESEPIDGKYNVERVLADYVEPLTIDSVLSDGRQFINKIYPTEYAGLPGVPQVQYRDEQFWASRERTAGTEYIEIDLGLVQAVNYLSFEATRKPVSISVDYDLLDQGPSRVWKPVTFSGLPHSALTFSPEDQSPWAHITMDFTSSRGRLIFTRYLRIGFTRLLSSTSPFTAGDGTRYPWSIEARNLRLGRNISN